MATIEKHGGLFGGGSSTKIKGQVAEKVTFAEAIKYGEPVSVRHETIPLPTPIGAFDYCKSVATSENGKYVATVQTPKDSSAGGSIALFKRNGDELVKLPNPTVLPEKSCRSVAFYKNDLVAFAHTASSSTLGAGVTLYRIKPGDIFEKVATSEKRMRGTGNLLFSPDGKLLFASSSSGSSEDYNVSVYQIVRDEANVVTGFYFLENLINDGVNTLHPRALTITPDSKYLVVARWNGVRIYEISGNTFTRLADIDTALNVSAEGATFSPDGKMLVISVGTSNMDLRCYSWQDGVPTELIGVFDTMPEKDTSSLCFFSSDGKILFSHGGKIKYKWNGERFHRLKDGDVTYSTYYNPETSIVTPDGKNLIITYPFGYYKNTLKVYKNNTVPLSGDYSLGYALQGGNIGEVKRVMSIFN
ncbi:WD40 repeat domain-containing protein [Pseudobacillus sp. 179-B 2D1 NHS]|uniref:WD40 repeat domain-containing protein n=1 Tax=Pseudobacillus sp. 179-B 2D1 NHS TaxID=3374292 RepID=UPI00387917D0